MPAHGPAGGEMGARLRSHPWAEGPLGPRAGWPASLHTAVAVMLGSAQPAWLTWGAEDTLLYNDACASLLGDAHPQALGRPLDTVGGSIWEQLRPLQEAALQGGGKHITDMPFALGGAGLPAVRWLSVSCLPLHDASGTVAGVYYTAVETSEMLSQQVEERTRERDHMWNLSPDLMCVSRLDGTLLNLNPAWERLLGWPVVHLLARQNEGIRHPEDDGRYRAMVKRTADGEPVHNVELRYRHRDGSWRWVSWTAKADQDRIYALGRDVTEQIQAGRALAAAEAARHDADALYRAYFEHTAEALFVIRVTEDGGFVIEQLNPTHQRTMGLPIERVGGKRIEEVLPPEVAARVAANYRQAIEAGHAIHYRETFDLTDEVQHWDTMLVPIHDAEGRITRLIGSGRNMTRQLVAEEALRQAQKMEAIGQLTGGIAHDFNNLLGAIVGCLDLIRHAPGDADRVARWADVGLAASERGARLTAQLLAFSRAQRLELRPLVVARLLEDMRDLLARTLGPLVRLVFDLDHAGVNVLCDPTQLEMAVLNLAINARDAMPGGGTLRIGTRVAEIRNDPDLADGRYVELAVTDSGTGMPAGIAERAFDPFFTTKTVGKGTGLGLSQVYGIARQAGGIARIDSRSGEGTTVRIYLRETDLATAPAEAARDEQASDPSHALSVLVVDDDQDMRETLVESLKRLGYRVRHAADGPTALLQLEAELPDLLVADFAMPGMTGAELAFHARRKREDLPVIFVSGYADTAAIEGLAGPPAPLLRKPFRIAELQQAIARTTAAL